MDDDCCLLDVIGDASALDEFLQSPKGEQVEGCYGGDDFPSNWDPEAELLQSLGGASVLGPGIPSPPLPSTPVAPSTPASTPTFTSIPPSLCSSNIPGVGPALASTPPMVPTPTVVPISQYQVPVIAASQAAPLKAGGSVQVLAGQQLQQLSQLQTLPPQMLQVLQQQLQQQALQPQTGQQPTLQAHTLQQTQTVAAHALQQSHTLQGQNVQPQSLPGPTVQAQTVQAQTVQAQAVQAQPVQAQTLQPQQLAAQPLQSQVLQQSGIQTQTQIFSQQLTQLSQQHQQGQQPAVGQLQLGSQQLTQLTQQLPQLAQLQQQGIIVGGQPQLRGLTLPVGSSAVTPATPASTSSTQQSSSAAGPIHLPNTLQLAGPGLVNLNQLAGGVQLRPQGGLVLPAGSMPGQLNLQGTIIQTANGNRILIQQPLLAGQQINLAQLPNLAPAPSSVDTSQAALTTQPTNSTAPTPIQPAKPATPNLNLLNLNAAQGAPQIFIRAPVSGSSQPNQNVILQTLPAGMLRLPTPVSTTTTSSTPLQQPQMLLAQPAGTGLQPIQPAQVVNTLGQPIGQQVLGNINMVNSAQNVNINILPAGHNLSGQPASTQPTLHPAPTVTATQPQTISIVNSQGQTVALPRSVLMGIPGMKINLPNQPLPLAMQTKDGVATQVQPVGPFTGLPNMLPVASVRPLTGTPSSSRGASPALAPSPLPNVATPPVAVSPLVKPPPSESPVKQSTMQPVTSSFVSLSMSGPPNVTVTCSSVIPHPQWSASSMQMSTQKQLASQQLKNLAASQGQTPVSYPVPSMAVKPIGSAVTLPVPSASVIGTPKTVELPGVASRPSPGPLKSPAGVAAPIMPASPSSNADIKPVATSVQPPAVLLQQSPKGPLLISQSPHTAGTTGQSIVIHSSPSKPSVPSPVLTSTASTATTLPALQPKPPPNLALVAPQTLVIRTPGLGNLTGGSGKPEQGTVQTIQLTPHQQVQLAQIQRTVKQLMALPSRNEQQQQRLRQLGEIQQQILTKGRVQAIIAQQAAAAAATSSTGNSESSKNSVTLSTSSANSTAKTSLASAPVQPSLSQGPPKPSLHIPVNEYSKLGPPNVTINTVGVIPIQQLQTGHKDALPQQQAAPGAPQTIRTSIPHPVQTHNAHIRTSVPVVTSSSSLHQIRPNFSPVNTSQQTSAPQHVQSFNNGLQTASNMTAQPNVQSTSSQQTSMNTSQPSSLAQIRPNFPPNISLQSNTNSSGNDSLSSVPIATGEIPQSAPMRSPQIQGVSAMPRVPAQIQPPAAMPSSESGNLGQPPAVISMAGLQQYHASPAAGPQQVGRVTAQPRPLMPGQAKPIQVVAPLAVNSQNNESLSTSSDDMGTTAAVSSMATSSAATTTTAALAKVPLVSSTTGNNPPVKVVQIPPQLRDKLLSMSPQERQLFLRQQSAIYHRLKQQKLAGLNPGETSTQQAQDGSAGSSLKPLLQAGPSQLQLQANANQMQIQGSSGQMPGNSGQIQLQGNSAPMQLQGSSGHMQLQAGSTQMQLQAGSTQMQLQAGSTQMQLQAGSTQMQLQAGSTQMQLQAGSTQIQPQAGSTQMQQGNSGQMQHQGNSTQMQLQGSAGQMQLQGSSNQMPLQGNSGQMPVQGNSSQLQAVSSRQVQLQGSTKGALQLPGGSHQIQLQTSTGQLIPLPPGTAQKLIQSGTGQLQLQPGATIKIVKKFIPANIPKKDLFASQLKRDQQAAVAPDCQTPFASRQDAIKRLLRYHVYQTQEPTAQDFVKDAELYEDVASELLKKKQQMIDKYRYLIYNDSMRSEPCSEMVMLEKMFLAAEKDMLATERNLAEKNPDEFEPKPSHEMMQEEEEAERAASEDEAPEQCKDELEVESGGSNVSLSSVPMKKRKHLWSSEDPSPKYIKEEKEAGASYSVQSSGGLKFVIRNSPSPCPIKTESNSSDYIKQEGEESQTWQSYSECKTDPSPLHEVLSDDGDDTDAYSSNEQRQPQETFQMMPSEVKNELMSPERSPSRLNSSAVMSDISYGSSQETGNHSEADNAVAGLLSSGEWQDGDDVPQVHQGNNRDLVPGMADTSASDTDLMGDLDPDVYQQDPSDMLQDNPSPAQEMLHNNPPQSHHMHAPAQSSQSLDHSQSLLPTSQEGNYGVSQEGNYGGDLYAQPSMSRAQQLQGLLQPSQSQPTSIPYSQQMSRLQQVQGLLQTGQVSELPLLGSSSGDMFSDPESPGGLNGEMESAINSILSLQQGSSFSDDPLDDSFTSQSNFDLTNDTSLEEGDDLEAAVNSILM